MYDNVIIFYIKLFAFSKNRAILNTEKCSCKSMDVTVHTPLSREVFWHEYAKIPDIKPKFHCHRQFEMNFGNVTENRVNSNVWSRCEKSYMFLELQ